ncbi:MAG: prolyl oligopeptidase family serine peptidase [Kiritimatiellae bacterium]|nr:prolyl oligopeptidase family serine peptidase [Kiritimatiellia bacterium]
MANPDKGAPVAWDDTRKHGWPAAFKRVAIPSSVDGVKQAAYFLAAPEGAKKVPVLVSLHTWSAGYEQQDPLAPMARKEGWIYIHPNFRGRNNTPDACLSDKALADIDDAIQYALDQPGADAAKVFVTGASGGGMATLGAYMRSRHEVRLFLSWVPISDLVAWHGESLARKNKRYADEIVACTSDGAELNMAEARRRSPLHMEGPVRPRSSIEIFAGIHDGHTGSVPVSQSLLFFNRLAEQYGHPERRVGEEEIARLLARDARADMALGKVGDRAVLFKRSVPGVDVTIFEGGHEMVVDACFKRIQEMAGQ